MPAPRKYPDELRERALRMVDEAMAEDPRLSVNAATKRIGQRVGIVPDTLRNWAKQHRIDRGQAPGTTTADAERIKKLEQENRELRRANEILLAASSFFARELDPRLPW
jgi:transposase